MKARARRTTVAVLVAAAAGVTLLVPQPAAAGRASHTFKIATAAPEQSIWMQAYRKIAGDLEDRLPGEVTLKCYPGGVQGDEQTVLRKIRIGQLHGAGFMGVGLALICPDAQVLQLPLQFRDYRDFDCVFGRMEPFLEEACLKNGYVVLGWPELGFSYLFSRDKVVDVDGLRRAKPWLMEDDPISQAMFAAAGVAAVPAQVGDVLTGLHSGLLRTVIAPPLAMVSMQWHSRVGYRLDLRLVYAFGVFAVSERSWRSLAPKSQRTVKEVVAKRFAWLNAEVRRQNSEALIAMEKRHIDTLRPAQENIRAFEQTAASTAERLKGRLFSTEALARLRQNQAACREQQRGD